MNTPTDKSSTPVAASKESPASTDAAPLADAPSSDMATSANEVSSGDDVVKKPWLKYLGVGAFWFFLIKGLLWLIVPAVLLWLGFAGEESG